MQKGFISRILINTLMGSERVTFQLFQAKKEAKEVTNLTLPRI